VTVFLSLLCGALTFEVKPEKKWWQPHHPQPNRLPACPPPMKPLHRGFFALGVELFAFSYYLLCCGFGHFW
jgi:hypothetical protein